MRWRMVWAIPWLLATLPAVLLTQASTAQDDNLLVNGGFEDGTAGWLAIGGELTVSDAFAHGGSYASVFATDSTSSRREISHCLAVAPSVDYDFQGYAARREGDDVSTLRLDVHWHDREDCLGSKLWTVQSPMIPLDGEEHWYELAVGGRSPDAARSAYLTVEVQESEATVFLDDFAVSSAVAPTETPTVEPSASPTRTATPRPPIPSPSATPHVSPTASSWQRTPVPVQGALRNGGFEEADSEGLPSFWRKYGGELARTNKARFEGQFAAALSSQTSSTKWVYQLVTVEGGRAYVLSAHALKADPAVAAAYLRLSWYANPDGSGQAIDSADSTSVLVDESPEFRFLTTEVVVAPGEAASAKVRLMMDPAGQAPGTVYFDAVTFEETTLPQPTPSPTATPSVVVDEQTPTPTSPALTESASTPRAGQRAVPTPGGSATTPHLSPGGPSSAGKPTPAALGAVRAPATATATATAATHVSASVYRQRKSDPSVGDEASARAEREEGGLPTSLLALAAGIPALAGVSAGMYYWRWRRARLR